MGDLPSRAEFIIIGAGITGTSIAYHLAKSGATNIVVLERKTPASGQSGKSHAGTPQFYTQSRLIESEAKCTKFYQDFEKIVGGAPVFHRVGVAYSYSESSAAVWEKHVSFLNRYGLHSRSISSSELRQIAPQFHLDTFYGACYEEDGGYIDSQLAVTQLVNTAKDLGVEFLSNCPVTGFDIQNQTINSVIVKENNKIRTDVVVNAAGVGSRGINSMAGVSLPIAGRKANICMLKREERYWGDHLYFVDLVNRAYFRAQGKSMTDFGLSEAYLETTFEGERSEDSENYYDGIPDEQMMRYVEAASIYPGLKNGAVYTSYSCVYDKTPDGQMMLGEVPRIKDFYIASGFNGHGFKFAPAVGQAISELVTKGRTQELDLNYFRPSRFIEGEPIQSDVAFDI